jgi:hypothetical protein
LLPFQGLAPLAIVSRRFAAAALLFPFIVYLASATIARASIFVSRVISL